MCWEFIYRPGKTIACKIWAQSPLKNGKGEQRTRSKEKKPPPTDKIKAWNDTQNVRE